MSKKPDQRTDTWLPLYVGDYLRDTGHLTAAQHGAYLLLLMAQWTSSSGFLPADPNALRRIARMDQDEWRDGWPALQAFFKQCSDGCYSPRLARERANTEAKRAKYVDRAEAAAHARWNKKKQGLNGGANASSNASSTPSSNARSNASEHASTMLGICPSPSPSQESPDGDLERRHCGADTRGTRLPADWTLSEEWEAEGYRVRMEAGLPPIDLDVEAAKFRDHWTAKAGKDATKVDWLATWRNWVRNAKAAPGGPILDLDPTAISQPNTGTP